MMKTKTWAALVGGFLLLSVIAALIVYLRPAPGTVANLYRDGEPLCSVDLSLVTEPYEFTLTDGRGSNVIRVEPGRIAVVDADCPDRICVKSGWHSDSAAPIVCRPHRLVIRIEKNAAAGSEAVPDAVSE